MLHIHAFESVWCSKISQTLVLLFFPSASSCVPVNAHFEAVYESMRDEHRTSCSYHNSAGLFFFWFEWSQNKLCYKFAINLAHLSSQHLPHFRALFLLNFNYCLSASWNGCRLSPFSELPFWLRSELLTELFAYMWYSVNNEVHTHLKKIVLWFQIWRLDS